MSCCVPPALILFGSLVMTPLSRCFAISRKLGSWCFVRLFRNDWEITRFMCFLTFECPEGRRSYRLLPCGPAASKACRTKYAPWSLCVTLPRAFRCPCRRGIKRLDYTPTGGIKQNGIFYCRVFGQEMLRKCLALDRAMAIQLCAKHACCFSLVRYCAPKMIVTMF